MGSELKTTQKYAVLGTCASVTCAAVVALFLGADRILSSSRSTISELLAQRRSRFVRLVLVFLTIASTTVSLAQTPGQQSPPPSYDTKDAAVQFTAPASAPASDLVLWYRHPAKQWTEALPVGNGRMGAMVFGGINREILQLNEATLWPGGPHDYSNADALAALPTVRKLVFDGKYKEAEDYINTHMMGRPGREMPYQPLGNVLIDFAQRDVVSGYQRSLDLDTAVASTSFSAGEVAFTRAVFVSPVDQVIAIRISANKAGQIDCSLRFQTEQKATVHAAADSLIVSGKNSDLRGVAGALTFQARVRVVNDSGSVAAEGDSLRITAANAITIYIAAATSYKRYDDVSGDPEAVVTAAIQAAVSHGYDAVRRRHAAEHQRLFRRVHIDLGKSTAASQLPTDERIINFDHGNDPQFAALYYQFGRYLLISSSRPGSQASKLQGI